MKKIRLMTPGPTEVPPEVLLSAAAPMIHHRTEQFRQELKEAEEGLKYVFQTASDVLMFASSGTGGMEACVCNLLSPGDTAIVIRGGKFGERFGEICEAYGVEVLPMDVAWGEAPEPEDLKKLLTGNSGKGVKAVFTTACETSTGVAADIQALAEIVGDTEAALAVDAISSLGCMDLKTDEWGVDAVVAGSQKGLMIPPGLGFLSLSEKAWRMVDKSKCPKYYFDVLKARKSMADNDTPYTPAVSLIIQLNKALGMIREEGLEKVFARHSAMAEATRQAAVAMGLELFAARASNSLTAVRVPENIDGTKLVSILKSRYGIWVAGGQGSLKGKIFRVAHMGYSDDIDCLGTIAAIETVLISLGHSVKPGVGTGKAGEVLEAAARAI